MADEDAAPQHAIVDAQTNPPDPVRPLLLPQSVRHGEITLDRSKDPYRMLWSRTLNRYWLPAIVIWLAVSGIVLLLIYARPDVSFIDARFLVATATLTCVAVSIWGAFLWIEAGSGHVSDPDLLSYRIQSLVYTLPPLTMRVVQAAGDERAEELIRQYLQRIDHLRFAIDGIPKAPGKGRCILITSAVCREGRSTLAAQLAARCADAGTSTLLIDADLYDGALNTLLRVPDGPGLSEVVAGMADLHQAFEPVQAGNFHLLQAGAPPVQDSLQFLQNPMVGEVIARCRERFDLIIIDCAPVVPSPKPLVLCKWVDGVIFAARYGYSRYPQIEWARRKLAATGVPIIAVALVAYPIDDSPA